MHIYIEYLAKLYFLNVIIPTFLNFDDVTFPRFIKSTLQRYALGYVSFYDSQIQIQSSRFTTRFSFLKDNNI